MRLGIASFKRANALGISAISPLIAQAQGVLNRWMGETRRAGQPPGRSRANSEYDGNILILLVISVLSGAGRGFGDACVRFLANQGREGRLAGLAGGTPQQQNLNALRRS